MNALLERRAVAVAQASQERFELKRPGDVLVDFDEFASGEFSPARADGSVVAEAAEEELDFGEGKAHVTGEADQKDAMDGVGRVMALSAEPLGCREEAAFFVVADGGGVEVGAAGELADFHNPP